MAVAWNTWSTETANVLSHQQHWADCTGRYIGRTMHYAEQSKATNVHWVCIHSAAPQLPEWDRKLYFLSNDFSQIAEPTKTKCATSIWCISLNMVNHSKRNIASAPDRQTIIGAIQRMASNTYQSARPANWTSKFDSIGQFIPYFVLALRPGMDQNYVTASSCLLFRFFKT